MAGGGLEGGGLLARAPRKASATGAVGGKALHTGPVMGISAGLEHSGRVGGNWVLERLAVILERSCPPAQPLHYVHLRVGEMPSISNTNIIGITETVVWESA